ncbi:MAG: hypothetical protein JWM11_1182 [Planctomycetaceae bacterium]|nr:hypothetical protein [Planctomycetaceae bacterium]
MIAVDSFVFNPDLRGVISRWIRPDLVEGLAIDTTNQLQLVHRGVCRRIIHALLGEPRAEFRGNGSIYALTSQRGVGTHGFTDVLPPRNADSSLREIQGP